MNVNVYLLQVLSIVLIIVIEKYVKYFCHEHGTKKKLCPR